MRNILTALLTKAFLVFMVLQSHAINMGITTGGSSGTYIQIGQDLRKVAQPSGITLKVFESKGSIQNILDVRKKRGVQVGIVQSDVLEYVKSISANKELKRIAKKIRLVYPLYNEEVHILASKDIESLADLEGKRVAIGTQSSGTYLTAKTLFHNLEMTVEEIYTNNKDALEKLRNDEIDAMIYVAGIPANLFAENTKKDDKFHLLTVDDKALYDVYSSVTIPANTYPWQDKEVQTVSVKATLVSFAYKGDHCKNVAKLSRIIKKNKKWLDENGHSKWKQVNLLATIPNWEQYDCVAKNGGSKFPSGIRIVK